MSIRPHLFGIFFHASPPLQSVSSYVLYFRRRTEKTLHAITGKPAPLIVSPTDPASEVLATGSPASDSDAAMAGAAARAAAAQGDDAEDVDVDMGA
jgi:hypothetical protein